MRVRLRVSSRFARHVTYFRIAARAAPDRHGACTYRLAKRGPPGRDGFRYPASWRPAMKNGKFRSTLSRFAPITAAAMLAFGAASAQAATTTGTLTVTAAVASVCSVGNATLAFGTYNPGGGNLNQSTTIGVRCTKGTPFTVALNGGGSGNVAARQMSSTGTPAEKLAYQLYSDSGRTTVWGNTAGALQSGTGAGMGVPQTVNFTVYGQVPDNAANQAAAGLADYTDSVTITVTY
jgi:spore coat protein U-like protein